VTIVAQPLVYQATRILFVQKTPHNNNNGYEGEMKGDYEGVIELSDLIKNILICVP